MHPTAEVTLRLSDIAQIHSEGACYFAGLGDGTGYVQPQSLQDGKIFFRTSQEVREQIKGHPRQNQIGIYCIREAQRLQVQRIE